MHRRSFLAVAGALAAGGFAGCVDDARDVATVVDDRTPDGSSRRLVDATLRTVDGGCGRQVDDAAVAFEADAGRVRVTGTIWGSDTCAVATLVDASDDAQADELTVTVGTKNRETEGTPVCGQCIVELDYRAEFAFEGGIPGAVTVVHDHGDDAPTVATATAA